MSNPQNCTTTLITSVPCIWLLLRAHVIVLDSKLKKWPYNYDKLIQQESSIYILISVTVLVLRI